MYRTRRNQKLYEKRNQETTTCPFCDPAEINYRIREETKHAYVILNKTPYEVWEHHKVLDSLMVIPKRHVPRLSDLTDGELLDISRLTAKYEDMDYNVYARATGSSIRSISHQHTHLFKLSKKWPRISLYVQKPYIVINY